MQWRLQDEKVNQVLDPELSPLTVCLFVFRKTAVL